jgi:peptidoglycan hydrolase CwlO-like protein
MKNKKLIIIILAVVCLVALSVVFLTSQKKTEPADSQEFLIDEIGSSDELDEIEKDMILLDEDIKEVNGLFDEIEKELDEL